MISKSGPIERWTLAIVVLNLLAFAYYTWVVQQQRDLMVEGNAASAAAFQVGERAWVGATDFPGPDPAIEPGRPSRLVVRIKNGGKTPALDARTHLCVRAFRVGEAFAPACIDNPGVISRSVFWPGQELTMTSAPLIFDAATVTDLKSSKRPTYLWGEISYGDIFGARHETTFCMRLRTDLKSADMCETYNRAN